MATCLGKSTYARCGIIVNVTPLEPEWRGKITIEISNTTPLPAKIYANEGIAQILFFRADQVCEKSYADKKGKYQDQKGLTLAVRGRAGSCRGRAARPLNRRRDARATLAFSWIFNDFFAALSFTFSLLRDRLKVTGACQNFGP